MWWSSSCPIPFYTRPLRAEPDADPDGKRRSQAIPLRLPTVLRRGRSGAFRSSCAISTCGSRATAPGIIADHRSTARLSSSSSPPCCAARTTAAIGWSPRPSAAGSWSRTRRFSPSRSTVEGEGRDQRLIFRTNLDEIVTAGPEHPLRVETAADGEPAPYILVRARSRGAARAAGLLRAGRSRHRGDDRRRDANSACGARACFSSSAIPGRIGNEPHVAGVGLALRQFVVPARPRPLRCTDGGPMDPGLRRDDAGTARLDELRALIRRLSGLKPGRRGFGGTADAVEAAAFRREAHAATTSSTPG